MKILNHISIILLSLILALSACTDDDKTLFLPGQTEPGTLNELSAAYYELDKSKPNEVFETMVWGETTYNFNAAVTYTIQVDLEGKDFTGVEDVTSSKDLTKGILVVEINRAVNNLIKKYGLQDETKQKVEFRVKASAGNDKTAQYTNIVSASIKPYKKVEYPTVRVVGDYSGWGDSWDKAQNVFSFKSDDMYEGWIYFGGKAQNGFKLAIPKEVVGDDGKTKLDWDGTANWGLEEGQSVESEAVSIPLWNDGGSKDIKAYSKNYYKFSFNKATAELTKLHSMDVFGIIGDGANGWGDNDDIEFEFDTKEQVFVAEVTLKDGGIKFRADHKWVLEFGLKEGGESGTLVEKGGNIPVTAGTYKITVDINNPENMTYKIEAATALDPSKIIAPVLTAPENMNMSTNESNTILWSAVDLGGQNSKVEEYILEMDLKGANFANAKELARTQDVSVSVTGQQFLDALEALGVAEETPADVDIRVKAIVAKIETPYISNVASFNLSVKQEDLVEVKAPLFITGEVFGSEHQWGNSADGVGKGLHPLFSDNNAIGDGSYSYTGYFNAGGFKFVQTPGNWDTALGLDKENSGKIMIGGNDNNIKVETAGWYKLDVNIKDLTYKFTEIETPTAESEFTKIGIIGNATSGDWATQTDLTQAAYNKHLWIVNNIRLTKKEAKFRANDSWDVNWGGKDRFPYGIGEHNSGDNTPILNAGNYYVAFNDITKEFVFIRLN